MDWVNAKWNTRCDALRGRGTFRALYVTNKGAADVFVMFFDSGSFPRSGEIPQRVWTLPGTTSATVPQTLNHEEYGGRDVESGIMIGISSTVETYTPVTALDFLIEVGFDVQKKNQS